ncbi:MAG: alpha/beta hydrolase, partial [Limisphaerales bacterium]
MKILCVALLLTVHTSSLVGAVNQPLVINLWSGVPPGDQGIKLGPESDRFQEGDKLIAGRKIIKLANVSQPQIAVYRPVPEKDTGAAVIVAPGGGYHILAYDLEGTEVAEWLNGIGVTGIVLKYRVPARDPERRHEAAVQDAQRAISMVRSRAKEWQIDPRRIGILGFSAGGHTAGMTALLHSQRSYEPQDATDRISCRPDFAALIYPGGFVERGKHELREEVSVPENVPPFFFAHAFDDRVTVQSSLLLASALKKAGVSASLHIYPSGGHGYGLRQTHEAVTTWPDRCEEWMRSHDLLDTGRLVQRYTSAWDRQ